MPETAAPAAPTEITQEGRYGVDNAIAEITRSAVEQTLAENAEGEDQPRDPKTGKFAPKNPQATTDSEGAEAESEIVAPPAPTKPVAPKPAAPAVTPAAPVEPADETPALPEGYVLAPKVEGRELKTQFKVLDPASGDELEVPELTIAFKAGGKERQLTLDHVVKMAEWGVYNAERHEQTERVERDALAVRDQYQQALDYVRQMQAERESLLTNDDYYLRTRAQYEQQNTPEARVQRATEDARAAREQAQLATVHAQGTQFYNSELLPAVNTIAKALPYVSDEEIGAKLLLISDRYKVQSQYGGAFIPPQQYAAIRQAIVNDVVPWAQQLNDARDTDRKSATAAVTATAKKAQEQARTAQIQAQKAKNLVGGRATRSATTAPGGTSTTPAPKVTPIRTVEDAERAAIRDTLAQTLGTG